MKVIASIIAIPLILLGLLILLWALACGPNSADVKVMQPMGDAINRYLTTQGKPPSLDSIPNLPYELECESKYKCAFSKDEKVYEVKFTKWSPSIFSLNISQSIKDHTGVLYNYRYSNRKFVCKKTEYYSNKRTGICNPLKQ